MRRVASFIVDICPAGTFGRPPQERRRHTCGRDEAYFGGRSRPDSSESSSCEIGMAFAIGLTTVVQAVAAYTHATVQLPSPVPAIVCASRRGGLFMYGVANLPARAAKAPAAYRWTLADPSSWATPCFTDFDSCDNATTGRRRVPNIKPRALTASGLAGNTSNAA